MKRPNGMAPAAFDSYIRACFYAEVSPQRISQTIGNAPASAGYHARDGYAVEGGKLVAYCAAVDLRVYDLNTSQIRALLIELATQGFAAWYRHEGGFSNNRHIHAIFAGLKMKRQLRAQVVDFLNDRNGLTNHDSEKFYTAPAALDAPIRDALNRANPKRQVA